MYIAIAVICFVLGLFFIAVAVWNLPRWNNWKKERVRAWEFGAGPHRPYYVRLTPNFGLGIRWFHGDRLRYAPHHGVQIARWSQSGVWYVKKQLFGKSTVKGERFLTGG